MSPLFRTSAVGVPSPASAHWLVDWMDGEDADFRWAWQAAGISTTVTRTTPMGPSVGTRGHRLRSWPTYAALAAWAQATAPADRLVAWQPIVGALTGLLSRARRRPPGLTVISPILTTGGSSWQQRLQLRGLQRAEHVVVSSRAGVDAVVGLGLRRERVSFVPFGVRPRREVPRPPGEYLLAAGRDARDWVTLAAAARGLDMDVVVTGPRSLPDPGPLRLAPQVQGEAFFELLEGAAGLVLPLARTDRSIGHNAMLAALAVGRPVVATRALGIEDYLDESTAVLVPARDPDALREGMRQLTDPATAAQMGRAALRAAHGRFSLQRFVAEVDAVSADRR
ncbi:glycosyltransferase [Kineococcus sp. SYSU DK006]|uniref:glycosyltransferase n=1 Tax=Kineococcus sp. SYSU DK006 TaxID=3383127 RepID=UPI003D7D01C5